MSKSSKTVIAKPVVKAVAKKPAAPKAAAKVEAPKAAPAKPKAVVKTSKVAASKTTEKGLAAKKPAAKKVTAPKKVVKEVIADCPLATTVSVAGSFNNWVVDVDMLAKDKKTGLWKIKLELLPGDYEYKFVCDGVNWDMGDNKIIHV